MSSLTPASPSTDARFSRTYWDIVWASFRRNRLALVALAVVVALFLIAIYTPLVSNDRPYAFYGVMPSWYRWTYEQVRLGGFGGIRTVPSRYRAEKRAWETGTITKNDIFRRMEPAEYRRLEKAFEEVDRTSRLDRAVAARWKAQTMPWNEISTMIPEPDRAAWEAVRTRVVAGLPAVYAGDVGKSVVGVDVNLRRLELQLDSGYRARREAIRSELGALTTLEYVTAEGDSRAPLDAKAAQALAHLEETFAPAKVELKPRWFFPLFDSLTPLDVFFMSGAAVSLVLFGPVRWVVRRRRRKPWRAAWRWVAAGLVPCAVAALLWNTLHRPMFETIRFKREVAHEGVRMDRAFWPPHRWRADELPETRFERPLPPSLRFPLGTDDMSRDLLCQVLWGSRISLAVGFVSTAIATAIGIFLGSLAGYFRSWVDIGISRLIEWFLCFPLLFIVLAARALLPPSIFFLMLVIGAFNWMIDARLVRGEFLRLANQDFVTAARAAGAGHGRIIFRHMLPNGLAPVLVAAAFGVSAGILIESSLSFLGFGVRPPEVSWGSILSSSRVKPEYPWLILTPGFLIWLTVSAYNLLGDGLRDAIDPRLKV